MTKMGFDKKIWDTEIPEEALKEARRLIASQGGLARSKKMSPKEREEIARKGGLAGGRGRK